MKCCAKCFGDRGLEEFVAKLSKEIGKCSWCESLDVTLIEARRLADFFEPLTNVYEPSPEGSLLVEHFKNDWAMFSHARMDIPRSKDLLAEILNDGEIVRQNFVPSARFKSDALVRWEQLRDELMYGNRYFPDVQIDAGRFEQLLVFLPARDVPTKWFRSRVCEEGQHFNLESMGPPPKRVASHGRANPPGIPYLYVGSTPETAVSEVRPHTGEYVCVAEYSIPKETRLIDLRNPRQLISPFQLGDEAEIGQLRSDVAFLERLGDELTRPVLPQGAAIDYVPSQYLCEFIKKSGYDGVVYRSSVSNGMNLAMFKPDLARPSSMLTEYEVSRISVDINFRRRYTTGATKFFESGKRSQKR